MLDTAMGLFRRQGYHATGINQVLAESEAPRGSLYFHFPGGKQQLAAEAVEASGRQVSELLAAVVVEASGPREAVAAVMAHFAQALEESDFSSGCPVATVALEASAESAEVRSACDGAYGTWMAGLAAAFEAWGMPASRAGELAVTALSMLEGALLLCKVQRDVATLRTVGDQLAELLESARTEEV
ncbi:TetR/AcrR family transcriptional regulator [Saccharopolyspora pogona]|uniref:TetR/AcrR family transcriptional regulator n=1 Tax=Saccharopolyspora pogona TaxID=333966 RepID=UPI001CC22DCF|nr:TetR/AcrR family transcriptional regulator [Saccharopolyspora pogona]